MKTKLLSLLLALIMASSAFTLIGCGESETDSDITPAEESSAPDTETAAESEAAAETEAELTEMEKRALISDDIPEGLNFDGRTYSILTTGVGAGGFDYRTEIDAESITGDSLNDSVYNRNAGIEERFGITIGVTGETSPDEIIKDFVKAGTKDYDLVSVFNHRVHAPVLGKAVLNWLDTPYVDTDKPWHNKLANDEAIINGILYAICSDLSLTSLTYTHAIFANLEMIDDYGLSAEGLYDLVKEGKWTIDYLIGVTTDMYRDLNGNGTADATDQFGFGYDVTNPADVWFTAFGGDCSTVNEEGEIELTYMNETTVAMLEKLVDWHWNNEGMFMYSNQYEEETRFANSTLVFAPLRFQAAYSALRDMEDPYTMLPYPKWNEEQAEYYTNADDKFSTFVIPKTSADDLDFVSAVFEALCAESYKTVIPIYYDEALKGRYSNDPTTAEMVDLIMSGRKFDFAFQFAESCFSSLPYKFRWMIRDQNSNIASEYAASENMLKSSIKLTFDRFYQ